MCSSDLQEIIASLLDVAFICSSRIAELNIGGIVLQDLKERGSIEMQFRTRRTRPDAEVAGGVEAHFFAALNRPKIARICAVVRVVRRINSKQPTLSTAGLLAVQVSVV